MIAAGEQAPEARVWLTPRDEVALTVFAKGTIEEVIDMVKKRKA